MSVKLLIMVECEYEHHISYFYYHCPSGQKMSNNPREPITRGNKDVKHLMPVKKYSYGINNWSIVCLLLIEKQSMKHER